MITATDSYLAALAKPNLPLLYLVEIDGYGKVFTTSPWPTRKCWIKDGGISNISQSVDPVNCSSSLSDVTISVLDYRRLITSDFPTFLFEGKKVVLQQGFEGLDLTDFITLFTGIVNTVATNDDGTSYDFDCVDYNRLNQQIIYFNGDDGIPDLEHQSEDADRQPDGSAVFDPLGASRLRRSRDRHRHDVRIPRFSLGRSRDAVQPNLGSGGEELHRERAAQAARRVRVSRQPRTLHRGLHAADTGRDRFTIHLHRVQPDGRSRLGRGRSLQHGAVPV